MAKKKIFVSLGLAVIVVAVAILTIASISGAELSLSNQGTSSFSAPADSAWGRMVSRFYYSFLDTGTFTVYGQILQCATTPTDTHVFKQGQTVTASAEIGELGGFVNWFRGSPYDGIYTSHPADSRQFLKEEYVSPGGTPSSFTCDAGAYWNNDCYVDTYECENLPCYDDSDCESGETCDKSVLSQKIPNAGICIESLPTHQTQVYRCANGVKTDLGRVSYGSPNFCMSASDTKYLIGTTDQCLSYTPTACTVGCGNGRVDSGETCSNCPEDVGACQTCTPNCAGKCGGVSDGCGGSCDADCEGGDECDGVCERALGLFPTDSCIADCERDIASDTQIYNLHLANLDGSAITGNLIPGQYIKVLFTVRTETMSSVPYLAEAGIIPFSVATEWDMAKPEGFFSLFGPIKESKNDACCPSQENIADNSLALKSGIYYGTQTATQDFEYRIRVPYPEIKDFCYSNKYYSNESKYEVYAIVKNGCFKDGYRKNTYVASIVNVNTSLNTSSSGKTCNVDADCGLDERCLDAPGFLTGKTCQVNPLKSGNLSFQDIKKISLTKEEIKIATTPSLASSICISKGECLDRPNHTITCPSIKSLRTEGTLVANTNSIFDTAKAIASGTITGAGIGTLAGIGLCVTGIGVVLLDTTIGTKLSIAAIPAVATACTAVISGGTTAGALIGASIGVQSRADDELIDRLNANDDSAIGICTAEPAGSSITGFLEKIGKAIPIPGLSAATSGAVVMLVGFILLIFLLTMLGGRR